MTQLTARQIVTIAGNAGWPGDLAFEAAYMARAISHGWDNYTTHAANGAMVYGLWGIEVGQAHGYARGDLYDANKAARAALELYRAGGSSWSEFALAPAFIEADALTHFIRLHRLAWPAPPTPDTNAIEAIIATRHPYQ